MNERLNEHQARWQRAALDVLLVNGCSAAPYGRGPWIPVDQAVAAVRRLTGCTAQAASGALRSLRSVGLADSSTTSEGGFWKATDAATRFALLSGEDDAALAASPGSPGGEQLTRDQARALRARLIPGEPPRGATNAADYPAAREALDRLASREGAEDG